MRLFRYGIPFYEREGIEHILTEHKVDLYLGGECKSPHVCFMYVKVRLEDSLLTAFMFDVGLDIHRLVLFVRSGEARTEVDQKVVEILT